MEVYYIICTVVTSTTIAITVTTAILLLLLSLGGTGRSRRRPRETRSSRNVAGFASRLDAGHGPPAWRRTVTDLHLLNLSDSDKFERREDSV